MNMHLGSSDLRNIAFELLQALRPAGFHPGKHLRRHGRKADAARLDGQSRFAAMLLEGDGGERFQQGVTRRVLRDRDSRKVPVMG